MFVPLGRIYTQILAGTLAPGSVLLLGRYLPAIHMRSPPGVTHYSRHTVLH